MFPYVRELEGVPFCDFWTFWKSSNRYEGYNVSILVREYMYTRFLFPRTRPDESKLDPRALPIRISRSSNPPRCNRKGKIRFSRSNFFLISGRRRVQLIRPLEKEKSELFLRSTPSLHSFLSSGSLDLVARGNKCLRCSEQQESFFTTAADLFERGTGAPGFVLFRELCVNGDNYRGG